MKLKRTKIVPRNWLAAAESRSKVNQDIGQFKKMLAEIWCKVGSVVCWI